MNDKIGQRVSVCLRKFADCLIHSAGAVIFISLVWKTTRQNYIYNDFYTNNQSLRAFQPQERLNKVLTGQLWRRSSKIRVIGYSSVLNLGAKVIYQSETAPGSLQGYVIGKGLFWGEFQKPSSSQGKNPFINDYPILNERKWSKGITKE